MSSSLPVTPDQVPSGATSSRRLTSRPGPVALVGAGLLAAGSALGAFVTEEGARATGELHLDQLIAADREAPLTAVAKVIDVGLGPMGAPILLLVLCLAVAVKNRWAALVLGGATLTGWFSVALGKLVFARHRPPIDQVHALVHETGVDSYPSGHTAFAAALVAGVILALRVAGRSTRWAWWLGIPFVVVVAGSRLYLGAHYLSDVVGSNLYVAGSVLLLSALLSSLITRWGSRHETMGR